MFKFVITFLLLAMSVVAFMPNKARLSVHTASKLAATTTITSGNEDFYYHFRCSYIFEIKTNYIHIMFINYLYYIIMISIDYC